MISSNCGILSETVPLPRISPLIKDTSRPALGIRMTSPPCEGLQLPVTHQESLMQQSKVSVARKCPILPPVLSFAGIHICFCYYLPLHRMYILC